MASRFTALPISAGEAFLLETDHAGRTWRILVDAGLRGDLRRHPLVKAITRESSRHCPDDGPVPAGFVNDGIIWPCCRRGLERVQARFDQRGKWLV